MGMQAGRDGHSSADPEVRPDRAGFPGGRARQRRRTSKTGRATQKSASDGERKKKQTSMGKLEKDETAGDR